MFCFPLLSSSPSSYCILFLGCAVVPCGDRRSCQGCHVLHRQLMCCVMCVCVCVLCVALIYTLTFCWLLSLCYCYCSCYSSWPLYYVFCCDLMWVGAMVEDVFVLYPLVQSTLARAVGTLDDVQGSSHGVCVCRVWSHSRQGQQPRGMHAIL